MSYELPDRYDDLRREWIAEHAGVSTIQKRRAERLNRQIRKRIRATAGAKPNPYDDNVAYPLWARRGATPEVAGERLIVLLCALAAPIGWILGRALYERIARLIPDRLRAFPIPALLWTAFGLGVLTALLYTPSHSFGTTFVGPYLIAQIPATFAAAGGYGILNGWLAIDSSASWWPLTPEALPVDFNLTLGPDDITPPGIFETADAYTFADLTPTTQISQSTQPVRLVVTGVIACLIGSTWMPGAVIIGVKTSVLEPLTSASSGQFH